VPEEASREAWRLAMTMTDDEAIGLHVAQWMPRGSLDLIEYAFRSSAIRGVRPERRGAEAVWSILCMMAGKLSAGYPSPRRVHGADVMRSEP